MLIACQTSFDILICASAYKIQFSGCKEIHFKGRQQSIWWKRHLKVLEISTMKIWFSEVFFVSINVFACSNLFIFSHPRLWSLFLQQYESGFKMALLRRNGIVVMLLVHCAGLVFLWLCLFSLLSLSYIILDSHFMQHCIIFWDLKDMGYIIRNTIVFSCVYSKLSQSICKAFSKSQVDFLKKLSSSVAINTDLNGVECFDCRFKGIVKLFLKVTNMPYRHPPL